MRRHLVSLSALALSVLLLFEGVVVVGAQEGGRSGSDDARLQAAKQELDQEHTGRSQQARIEALAKQFNVEPQVVENLRTAKQGWGEATIRLALARELMLTDPKTYPTMTESLQKVGELRVDGKGWGAIAKELGFKLGPVVSEAQRARHEFRAQVRVGGDGPGIELKERKQERADGQLRTERVEKPQRPERPERPQRPERPEKPERAGR